MSDVSRSAGSLRDGFFLGRYRLLRFVGADAYGEVYVAKLTSEHRTVVLRVFPDSVGGSPFPAERAEEIFSLASAVEHRSISRMSGLEQDQGYAFVAGDCPGRTDGEVVLLGDVCSGEGGRMAESRVRGLVLQLAEGLAHAHGFRGEGVPCGFLTRDSIAVTSQNNPVILHYGTGSVWRPDASREDDIRQLGILAYGLLTGLSETDSERPPSSVGVSAFWDGFVGRCLRAGGEGGYKNMSDLVSALGSFRERSGGRFRRFVFAGALVAVLAVIGVGLTVFLRRGGETSEACGQDGAAATATVGAADRLDRARVARDRGDSSGAATILREILSDDPGNRAAGDLLAQIQSEGDLAALAPVKKEALGRLGLAVELSGGQGFGARIAAVERLAAEAQSLLSAMRVGEAGEAYKKLSEAAGELLADDRVRQEALALQTEFSELLEEIGGDDGVTLRTEDSTRIGGLRKHAEDALETGHVGNAKERFAEALDLLRATADRATATSRLATARQSFLNEKAEADPALANRLSADVKAQVAALVARAEAAEQAEDWAAAETAWLAAGDRLRQGLDTLALAGSPNAGPSRGPTRFSRPASGNLVRNGDFEEGEGDQPRHWSSVDGLTVLWASRGHPGSCLVFDTSVQQKDKRALHANPGKPVERSEGGQYATVGAHEGVWAFSPPVPVTDSDRYFVVEADVWSTARSTSLFYPQVLLRGFQAFDPGSDAGTMSWFQIPHAGGPAFSEQFGAKQRRARAGDYLMVWRHGLVCRIAEPRSWTHYQLAFTLPETESFKPEVLLLKCYAMWPLGEYRFDNVSLRAVSKAEYEKVSRKGHSIEGFMPLE